MNFKESKTSKVTLFFIIIMAVCLTQFASDIYAPSLPAISHSLHTSINAAQWSMAIFMLGVALTQLIYGPWSEGVGRKRPLVVGLAIMLAGSIFCSFAPTIELLILGRFIQGCGAGACAALWRTIFRDVFHGEDLSKYGSYLGTVVMFIVPAAPLLGAYLQEYWGWRASFNFMTVYAVIALLLMQFAFRETSQHHHVSRLKWSYIGKTYRELFTHPVFMGMTVCTFLCYGAFFSWFIVGPVLLIENLNMTPKHFGWINFFGGGLAYALSGWLNGKYVKRLGMATMLRFGWVMMIIASLTIFICEFFFGLTLWGLVIPIMLFYFGSTFIWPNAFATAFLPFGKVAGYAGALYGFMQICGAAISGGLLAYLPDKTPLALATVMIIAPVLSLIIHRKIVQLEKVTRKKEMQF